MIPITRFLKSYWLLVSLYIALIFTLSSISDLPYISRIAEMDPRKFSLHVLEYGIFGLLLYTALNKSRFNEKALILTLIIGFAIGVIDEVYQSPVPGRNFNPLDIFSDGIGVISGAIIAHIKGRRTS